MQQFSLRNGAILVLWIEQDSLHLPAYEAGAEPTGGHQETFWSVMVKLSWFTFLFWFKKGFGMQSFVTVL